MDATLAQQIGDLQNQVNELNLRVTGIEESHKDQLSMIVMSGEMDKILAAMVISVGAAAMDTEVTLFFTFWSIAALRDPQTTGAGKNILAKIFGFLLPKGRNKLKLSTMNLGGYGPKVLRKLMKNQKVYSLDDLFQQAADLGITITICEMSMDLLGLTREEMIDYPSLHYAGVATFLADANNSRVQLFI